MSSGKKWRRVSSEADRQAFLKVSRGQNVVSVLNTLIKYGAWVAVAWFGVLGLRCLAGQKTDANLGIAILADIASRDRTVTLLCILVTVVAVGLMRSYKRQLRETVEHHGRLRQENEKLLDPRRSSSGLLASGETRKED